MKKDLYIYPAVFDYADDGISIEFPDLPGCLPCAKTTEEAVHNAKEAVALHLYGMEQDGDPIPEPTPVDHIALESNQIPILIEIYMPLHREAIDNSYVRKNVTLPRWLEKVATEKGINFSQVLQNALKEQILQNPRSTAPPK
jgi:predicted RNase H-like HicB family nuclease